MKKQSLKDWYDKPVTIKFKKSWVIWFITVLLAFFLGGIVHAQSLTDSGIIQPSAKVGISGVTDTAAVNPQGFMGGLSVYKDTFIEAVDNEHSAEVKAQQEAQEAARIAEAQKEEQAALQQPAQALPQLPQVYHSDDYYINYIINYESGGNPNAVNPNGACGLFQKLPCNVPLGDVSAQMTDGLSYINSRYGSPYNAYIHEINYGWY